MATETRNVQPALVLLGLALVAGGVLVLALLGWHGADATQGLVGSEVPAAVAVPAAPSRLWAVVAGLLMAAGGAAIGIGMNRWFRRS